MMLHGIMTSLLIPQEEVMALQSYGHSLPSPMEKDSPLPSSPHGLPPSFSFGCCWASQGEKMGQWQDRKASKTQKGDLYIPVTTLVVLLPPSCLGFTQPILENRLASPAFVPVPFSFHLGFRWHNKRACRCLEGNGLSRGGWNNSESITYFIKPV